MALINGKLYLNLSSFRKTSKCLIQLRNLSSKETITSSFTESRTDEAEERIVPKPVSYLPDHLRQTRKWIRQKPWWKFRYFININAIEDEPNEWSQSAEYPPIVDVSTEGANKRVRLEWYDAIKRLPTAQQKQYEISKHYSHLNFMLEPVLKQYNALPLQQYITRTHLISGQLPQTYDDINVDSILDNHLKQSICQTIALHLFETKQRKPSFEFKNSFISQIGFQTPDMRINTAIEEDVVEDVVEIIRRKLSKNYEHLRNIQVDMSANVFNSWWHKGFAPPFKRKRWFRSEQFDQSFTYRGTHALHLRTDKPLPQVLSLDDDICTKSEIQEYKHNLLTLGYYLRRYNQVSIPGFWIDHSQGFDFPNLICLTRQDMKLREMKNERSFDDKQDVLDGMAITSSFAWLNGMASNLGFTLYHELTYPLVTHVIITDGQFWSFYVYQLNTHSFHSDVDTNSLRNVCWSSGDLKLFDTYENGQLKGVNDQVLKNIVKFLIREPQQAVDVNLRPYLSEDNRSEDDIKELSYVLKRKNCNQLNEWAPTRQRVHLWEKIYKYHKEASPVPHIRTRPKLTYKYPPFFTH